MAEWRLAQRRVTAPAAGRIADVLARPGETMAAGAPVVSLLPPDNIFVRFFVPEAALATLHLGDPVALPATAAPPDLTATISFISPQAEYTPPLIYSESNNGQAGVPGRSPAAARPGSLAQSRPADRSAPAGTQHAP